MTTWSHLTADIHSKWWFLYFAYFFLRLLAFVIERRVICAAFTVFPVWRYGIAWKNSIPLLLSERKKWFFLEERFTKEIDKCKNTELKRNKESCWNRETRKGIFRVHLFVSVNLKKVILNILFRNSMLNDTCTEEIIY